MRIIAGEHRGRKLLPPEGDVTRPITDRVKQSLFDILSPYLDAAIVYDCFAGTGSMGLECLSRGAKHATFFEADRSALDRLTKNIAAMRVGDQATVVKGDLFKWFEQRTPIDARPHPNLLPEGEGTGGISTLKSTSELSRPTPSPPPGESRSEGDRRSTLARATNPPANLIFLDPPYRFLNEQPEKLTQLAAHFAEKHLAATGLVVFRHDANDHLALPPLNVVDLREYGGMTLEFLSLENG